MAEKSFSAPAFVEGPDGKFILNPAVPQEVRARLERQEKQRQARARKAKARKARARKKRK